MNTSRLVHGLSFSLRVRRNTDSPAEVVALEPPAEVVDLYTVVVVWPDDLVGSASGGIVLFASKSETNIEQQLSTQHALPYASNRII